MTRCGCKINVPFKIGKCTPVWELLPYTISYLLTQNQLEKNLKCYRQNFRKRIWEKSVIRCIAFDKHCGTEIFSIKPVFRNSWFVDMYTDRCWKRKNDLVLNVRRHCVIPGFVCLVRSRYIGFAGLRWVYRNTPSFSWLVSYLSQSCGTCILVLGGTTAHSSIASNRSCWLIR